MPPSLISNMRRLNKIIEDNKGNEIMDLSRYTFLAPPTLLPLLQYMEQNNIKLYVPNPQTEHYLEKVLGREKATSTTIPLRQLKRFPFTNYMHNPDIIEGYLDELTNEILSLIPLDLDSNGTNLLLYELLTNIYKHSRFKNAYILCQKYPNINKVDVCIIDDGVTIPGSLEEVGNYYEDDSDAIFNAINGATSDKEKYELHGRGLNTSVSIASLGFGEEVLIGSRRGFCTINKRGVRLWNKGLPLIEGTFISLRINTNKIKDITNYTRRRTFYKID